MFTRVRKDIVDDFIVSHYSHVVEKSLLNRYMYIIKTEKLTTSVYSSNLDLLLVGNGKDKYYLLPYPKSMFRYIFIFCSIVGVLGFFGGGFLMLFGLYLGTKAFAMPILWDIDLKTKKILKR